MESKNQFTLSVVIPANNEDAGIAEAVRAIAGIVETCAHAWEIIVVDDGSCDSTFEKVARMSESDHRIKALRLSRNFGKEAALLAGLQMSAGDAVITIDADLQHPPRLIPEMVSKWQEGAHVVDAVKRRRDKDSVLTRIRARVFNTVLSRLGGIDLQNSSDYKLLDRIVVDAISKRLPERTRFYRGLVDWVGYSHAKIPLDIEARTAGEGKWSVWKLVGLATTAIMSFTSAPLRIVTFLGFITLIFGVFVAGEALWSWFNGRAVSGFATMIITVLLLGSFIMISLGIMGEYTGKIYDEIKGRPAFLIAERAGFSEDEAEEQRADVCVKCGRPL